MPHPSVHALTQPDKVAYQMAATSEAITYRELDERSNQGAHLFRELGLEAGDHIALLMENRLVFMEICWAAQRSGLYYTPISRYLTQGEIEYIVSDCGAKLVITSPKCAEQIKNLVKSAAAPLFYMLDEPLSGFRSWDKEARAQPVTPILDESAGSDMLYSSGTTGRPKGVKTPIKTTAIDAVSPLVQNVCGKLCGMGQDSIYLSPAPLYHAAPLRFNMAQIALGGTSILMESFDAEQFLRLIETHKVTHAQLVPTMFVRILKLPEDVRLRYDLGSLRCAIHAAPLPGGCESQDDRLVGPDPGRVLRGLGRQRLHLLQLQRMAGASWHRGTCCPRNGQDPRRERGGKAARSDRCRVFCRRAGVFLS